MIVFEYIVRRFLVCLTPPSCGLRTSVTAELTTQEDSAIDQTINSNCDVDVEALLQNSVFCAEYELDYNTSVYRDVYPYASHSSPQLGHLGGYDETRFQYGQVFSVCKIWPALLGSPIVSAAPSSETTDADEQVVATGDSGAPNMSTGAVEGDTEAAPQQACDDMSLGDMVTWIRTGNACANL